MNRLFTGLAGIALNLSFFADALQDASLWEDVWRIADLVASRQAALTPIAAARLITCSCIPCMIWSGVIRLSSQSGSLGG